MLAFFKKKTKSVWEEESPGMHDSGDIWPFLEIVSMKMPIVTKGTADWTQSGCGEERTSGCRSQREMIEGACGVHLSKRHVSSPLE
jgi:hypothetical protein